MIPAAAVFFAACDFRCGLSVSAPARGMEPIKT